MDMISYTNVNFNDNLPEDTVHLELAKLNELKNDIDLKLKKIKDSVHHAQIKNGEMKLKAKVHFVPIGQI